MSVGDFKWTMVRGRCYDDSSGCSSEDARTRIFVRSNWLDKTEGALYYKYKVGPASEVFVFGGMYQFLLYFYETFLANFLVLGAGLT